MGRRLVRRRGGPDEPQVGATDSPVALVARLDDASARVEARRLAGIAFALVMPTALFLGMIAGLKEGSLKDRVLSIGGMMFSVITEFATGSFLILIMAVWLQIVPGATVFGEKAPWERLDMLDNVAEHSQMVADIATFLARRAKSLGMDVDALMAGASEVTGPLAAPDLTGDGYKEIVCGTIEGLYVYRYDGTPLPGFPVRTGEDMRCVPAVYDIDQDDGRAAGSLFVGADSFFGPLYLGAGFAEGGNASAYMFLGQRF